MHEFESGFSKWVIKLKWPIILLTIALILLAAKGGQYLSFTTNYRVFFSQSNPQLMAFDALERTYTKNDNVMFVLSPKDGNVFTAETLAAVEELTTQAWQIPYSIRVDSIANFQHTEAQGDDLVVKSLITDAASFTPEESRRTRNIALQEPLLAQRLISPKGDVTAVNAIIQLPGKNEAVEVPEVVAFAQNLAQDMTVKYPSIEFSLTGMVLMNNAFSEASQTDMKKLVPISFGLMVICLALLLRGLTSTFGTVAVNIFSIMAATAHGNGESPNG